MKTDREHPLLVEIAAAIERHWQANPGVVGPAHTLAVLATVVGGVLTYTIKPEYIGRARDKFDEALDHCLESDIVLWSTARE